MLRGKGSLGRYQATAITKAGPPISPRPCPAGLLKIADITSNNLVLTFNDLSLLYGDGTGVVCFNPIDPEAAPVAEIDGEWLGGTGRFADAGGEFSVRFDEAVEISPATQATAETGTVTGYVTSSRNRVVRKD